MASGDPVSEECRRLLEAFGYETRKRARTWVNKETGRTVSVQTVREWTLDELRLWLTQGAWPPQGG